MAKGRWPSGQWKILPCCLSCNQPHKDFHGLPCELDCLAAMPPVRGNQASLGESKRPSPWSATGKPWAKAGEGEGENLPRNAWLQSLPVVILLQPIGEECLHPPSSKAQSAHSTVAAVPGTWSGLCVFPRNIMQLAQSTLMWLVGSHCRVRVPEGAHEP